MSLVGNLEDLSLPDILQIVSLSKKSGVLTIEREGRQGRIFIREGRVIQTVSPRAGKTLGEILTSRSMVRTEDMRKALEIQRADEKKGLLGDVLVRMGLIGKDAVEKVVQEQIEEAIVYFLSWNEGTFSFELCDIESRGETSVDAHAFILEKGIDTQWLVLEGTRLMDEREREGISTEEEVAAAITETEPAESAAAAARAAVVLVDDDPVFRDQAREWLGRLNYRIVPCEGTEEALKAVRDFPQDLPPVVITDIVYPTSDGRGFLGGLELIERLRQERPNVPLIAITAYPDDNVRSKVGGFGVDRFIIKPPVAGGEGDEVRQKFYEQLNEALEGVKGVEAAPEIEEETPDRSEQEQLVEAIGDKKAAITQQEATITSAGLDRDEITLLQDMMQELQNPGATSEIGLLILRYAAEILNRAVLFVVKSGKAVGLGGFGVEVSSQGGTGGVRGISIPLDEPSLLEEVARSKTAYRGDVVHTPWNVTLMKQLGGQTPAEAVAIPLLASGKVRVILYGDNLPDTKPLPRTQTLEIFLAQAGLTMERVLLEKKLQKNKQGAEA